MASTSNDVKSVFECLKALFGKGYLENIEVSTVKPKNFEQFLNECVNKCILEVKKNDCILKVLTDITPFVFESELSNDNIWIYVLLNCALLITLKIFLDGSSDHILLSITEQKHLLTAVQFIIKLGIYPSLLHGVAVPIENRTKFPDFHVVEDLNFCDSHRRIVFSLSVLLLLSEQNTAKSVIMSSHLIDYLPPFIQLCYGPFKKSSQKLSKPNQSVLKNVFISSTNENLRNFFNFYKGYSNMFVTEDLLAEMWNDRKIFMYKFEALQLNIYQPLLVRDLLTLQNYARRSKLSPKWYKKICGEILSSILLRKNNVCHVIDGILQNMADSDNELIENSDNMKFEMIGKLIATIPSQITSKETYYSLICPQLIDLLRLNEDSKAPSLIACNALAIIAESDYILAEKYAFTVIITPILKLTKIKEDNIAGEMELMISEDELSMCITTLSKITFGSPVTTSILIPLILRPVFLPLISLYCSIHQGTSHLRIPLENLLTAFLNHSKDNVSLLNSAAFLNETLPLGVQSFFWDHVFFKYAESGGMCAFKAPILEHDILDAVETKSSGILDLLSKMSFPDLISDWFLSLLEKLCEGIPLQLNESKSLTRQEIQDNLVLLALIQKLAETDYTVLLKDVQKVISFVTGMLQRFTLGLTKLLPSQEILTRETLFLSLSILVIITSHKNQLTPKCWTLLGQCLKPLEKLKTDCTDPSIKALSKEVFTVISTRGACSMQDNNTSGETEHQREFTKLFGKLNLEKDSQSVLSLALRDLRDPSPPIKGHALIVLKKLLLQKDSQALEKQDEIFKAIEELLFDEDSYVYLTAIEALATLGTVYTDTIFPKMVDKFNSFGQTDRPFEVKLKLGEAIVRVSKSLGNTIVKYQNILLSCFLNGTRNSDPEVRSSSLSNLGEICKLLRFALGSNLQEIILCLESISLYDDSIQVRRSSVMVLTLMLRGLGKDSFTVLQDDLLIIYRLLKKIYSIETDDILKLHCQLALEEMREIVQQFSQLPQNYKREIKIPNHF